jgi:Asp-tRNA(Asn)/Glu-tRNA(Gln) amidotransferase A subunit family amidase
MQPNLFDRRQAIVAAMSTGVFAGLLGGSTVARAVAMQIEGEPKADAITAKQVADSCWIAGVTWTDEQCEAVAAAINKKLKMLRTGRENPPAEDTPMPLAFLPSFFVAKSPPPEIVTPQQGSVHWSDNVELPNWSSMKDVLNWSIPQLAVGIRKGRFTSVELTEFYLERLKSANEKLLCVVTMNANAIESAKMRDAELKQGKDRGILHGIPWGAKDIIAIHGLPTSWGVGRYADRRWDTTATVAKRLEDAGAVLLAKLSVGTLAWGDEWHGGKTKNPWNLEQGSSGSSAGSSSAVAARAVPFALGTETLGSIVSPTRVCATSGLRPTFGRVSRAGCMTLAWTMDKVGPIANRVEDCAIIFRELLGADGEDPTVVERPYAWPASLELRGLKVGMPARLRASEEQFKEWLLENGAEMVPVEFPAAPMSLMLEALSAEAASVHESLFRSAKDDHELGKWGPSFREAQWIRAIDYLHGVRSRVKMIRETEDVLRQVDLLIGDGDLSRMNLTGHPSLVVAFGKEKERNRPSTVVLTGKMFSEAKLMEIGRLLQQSHPPLVLET